MAKESFDKEIQFLRMLSLTNGAYNRKQYAERLGISVHTFDKTTRRLKEIMQTVVDPRSGSEPSKEMTDLVRFQYGETAEPMLLFLYRAKSMKETEVQRLSVILHTLQGSALTAMELLDACCADLPEELALPDEKTIRTDLKYLEEVGVIRKESGGRPYRYMLQQDVLTKLTAQEQLELYDFVDIMANTQVPSVQGYLLRDSLKKAIATSYPEQEVTEPFIYKYHYYSRILDEAHLYTLLSAIRQCKRVQFVYFPPKKPSSYSSQNTNPRFEREAGGHANRILPLEVVYDHQYGRWYVIGYQGRRGFVKFRMEGITQMEELDAVDAAYMLELKQQWAEASRYSWLVDTANTVTVQVRFFHPESGQRNFILDRVRLQGQWGTITPETDHTFLYEIRVNGTTEIKPWLRSFGSSCEVIAPHRLRQEMIKEWKEIAQYYESVREDVQLSDHDEIE
ncbi:helix-turn-helix transcriptional regulator [Paenibacillus xylanilyticus]|uniref:WYL domain-containing protein n=1 Tax=Paenibacillus xylanilyticus TaxID=248903 RepID=A0A7Y6C0Q0_9BACL|nr:WYL domain-containing protein [Paenibacillus xylanilyticus]NUU78447.1 WYL domain-containing protein [Paenibacillus xylanilyticus]